jgi:MFS family permease
MAVGTGVGGGVAALLDWRWAFLVVGVPGSLLALAVWRLPEPGRGEHDGHPGDMPVASGSNADDDSAVEGGTPPTDQARGMRAMVQDIKTVFDVRTLRALMAGTAVAAGALSGIGFWGPTFYARHTELTPGEASGLAAALVLVGALAGTLLGGVVTDRIRGRVTGAPMLMAGTAQATGAALMMVVFLDVPLVVRLVLTVAGVMFVVSAFPALAAMTSEVVGSAVRGLAFSVVTFSSGIASALSPLVIGAIADQFDFTVGDKVKGNLANAFLIVTPLVFIGATVLIRGRHHVATDLERARTVTISH